MSHVIIQGANLRREVDFGDDPIFVSTYAGDEVV